MTCILSCSHGVVIATAMVFSSTALFLTISRQLCGNNQPSDIQDQHILRPCLCSEEKKKQRKKNKKVKFAENVKEPKGNGEEYRRKRESLRRNVPEPVIKPDKTGSVCRNNMPANRIALYNGILRDRDHRVQCSY
ncbi:hypothetical protein Bca4012_098202 [Brassica carinata]|uniref:BnaC06g05400D protein n=4 Tax=Brassica TaxID=3705 RepID=A0A078HS86_BRANA|nr:PREDICTED: uncharacterized protein LOC106298410 [Brassica oleracea var. oleracea]XP_013698930.1 uncharacterized protein BNAC06G05400D [Brassica napus]CDY40149.1 BnaC06g05400D [Brassica napus]VDD60429.1 unnamed protein product [Brassica oleracea]